MNLKEVIYTILLIGALQGIIFNIYSLFTLSYRTKSFLYINLWVFFLSLNNFQAWLNERQISLHNLFLDHLHTPFYIFLAPMFYLFLVRYLHYPKNKWVLFSAIAFFSISFIAKLLLLYNLSDKTNDNFLQLHHRYNSIEEPIGFIITISIFTYSYFIYRKVDKSYLIRSYESLEWIRMFFILSVIGLMVWMIGLVHNIVYNNAITKNYYGILRLVTSLILYWIAYKSTLQQRLFDERLAMRKAIKSIKNKTVDNLFVKEEFDTLETIIIDKEYYTNPLLSVESLADELNISSGKLSKLIKEHKGTNFSDYINKLRVEKAKTLLLHPEFSNYTILSIGLESGFNSKSVFYSVFKKHTLQTPVQWKNNLIEILS